MEPYERVDAIVLEPLYESRQNGLTEIFSRQQLEEYYALSADTNLIREHIPFATWLERMQEKGEIRKLQPLEQNTSFGYLVKNLREKRGLSLEQLSNMCLISKEQLSWIETGILNPDGSTMQLLSNALGVYCEDLQNGLVREKPDYQESLAELQAAKEQLLKVKESIRKIQGFVNEHDVSRYVIREEEKSRILDTQTNEYLLLNGVPMEWENRKDAERFLQELEGKERKTEEMPGAIQEERRMEEEQIKPQELYRVDTKEHYLEEIKKQIQNLQKEEKRVQGAENDTYVVVNTATGKAVEQNGELLEFSDRATAQAYADELNKKSLVPVEEKEVVPRL